MTHSENYAEKLDQKVEQVAEEITNLPTDLTKEEVEKKAEEISAKALAELHEEQSEPGIGIKSDLENACIEQENEEKIQASIKSAGAKLKAREEKKKREALIVKPPKKERRPVGQAIGNGVGWFCAGTVNGTVGAVKGTGGFFTGIGKGFKDAWSR